MTPQLRSRESPSSRVYHSAPPAQQARFPARRRTVKTYGRRQSARSLRQQTLTQIDYLVPAHQPDEWAGTGDDGDDGDEDEHGRAGGGAGRGDRQGSGRPQKRRKTMGDAPEPSSTAPPSSAFHTQTLTQLLSEKGANEEDDLLLVQDTEDEDDARPGGRAVTSRKETISPPTKEKRKQMRGEEARPDGPKSREVSMIPQTPAHKRIKAEIPSSEQSPPLTPMLERYSPAPHRSPLKEKSTNADAPAPRITEVTARKKTPRTLVVQDSYSPVAGSLLSSASQVMEGHPSTRGTTAVQMEIPDSDDEFGGMDPSPQKTNKPASTASGGDAASPGTPTPMPRREEPSQGATQSVVAVAPTPLPRRVPLQELGPAPARHPTPEPAPDSEDLEADPLSPSPRRAQHPAVQSSNPAEMERETPPSSPQKSSPPGALPARQTRARTQFETQGLESQRVPLEAINSLAPKTDRSDIVISIHPEHVERIAAGLKNHEFRDYRLPMTVSRLWIYVTRPACELRYMATIGEAKEPGHIDGGSGVGNAEFNAGRISKFAYELLQVYQLNNPVKLEVMKENGWVRGPPQKYAYVPPAVVGELLGNLRCALFAEPHEQQGGDAPRPSSGGAGVSVSQEVEEQIRSDMARSTQYPSSPRGRGSPVVVPSSQDDEGEDMATPRAPRPSAVAGGPLARPSPPSRIDGASQAAPGGAGSGSLPALPPGQENAAAVRPSQATTASQPSTPLTSPDKSVPRPVPCSSGMPEFVDDSPIRLALLGAAGDGSVSSGPPAGLTQLLLGSSQAAAGPGVQDSLVADVRAPPEFVWNSEEEEEDAD